MPGTNPSTPRLRSVLRARSRGQAIMIVLLVISALMVAGAIFVRMVISERNMAELFIQKEKTFYLAEAGIEDGKATLASNPNWFTDNPHSPADDIDWLIDSAKGSIKQFGGGRYKIVRESGKNIIYSVGYFRNGRAIERVKYNVSPFQTYEFRLL